MTPLRRRRWHGHEGEPIDRALASIVPLRDDALVVLLTPQGETFNQKLVEEMSRYSRIVLVCGHYEGVDERVRDHLVDREISIGDFILTGRGSFRLWSSLTPCPSDPGCSGEIVNPHRMICFLLVCWSIPTIHAPVVTGTGRFPRCYCQVITGRSSHGGGRNR